VTEPPTPPAPTAAAPQPGHRDIDSLLENSRRHSPLEAGGPTPAWLSNAADLLAGLLQATVAARVEQATTALRTQLTEVRQHSADWRNQLDQLRDEIRLYLAELIASGATLDRDDANAALRGWSSDTLPARFAVTLNATITATLIADDADDAAAQALRLLDDLARDKADETVTITELHTDEIVELDELPDPRTLR
jgi:uncharacterized protein YciI